MKSHATFRIDLTLNKTGDTRIAADATQQVVMKALIGTCGLMVGDLG